MQTVEAASNNDRFSGLSGLSGAVVVEFHDCRFERLLYENASSHFRPEAAGAFSVFLVRIATLNRRSKIMRRNTASAYNGA